MPASTPSYLTRKTPGVYITEVDAFGTSVVGVPTAVPIFIGYTERAADPATGASLHGTAVPISSMAAYLDYFGGAAPVSFAVTASATGPGFVVTPSATAPGFALFRQMQLFFANGGSDCFVVSCGDYAAPGIAAIDLLAGLATAAGAIGPTMIVVPEACQLPTVDGSYASVAQAMLTQAATLQDRVAIFDLPGCLRASSLAALQQAQQAFWRAIEPAIGGAGYGAAYAPALATTIVDASDIAYSDLLAANGDNSAISALLRAQATQLYATAPTRLATVDAAIATLFPVPASAAVGAPAQPPAALDAGLAVALPLYQAIKQQAATLQNVAAPSGAMAGIWTQSDNLFGVWNAPANIAVMGVSAPLYAMSDVEQGGFNAPANGEAINIIRMQPNRGPVVWGARTLDGDSPGHCYIQVRRTLTYVQQSIKTALRSYVFAANDATTWSTVTAMIATFLTGLWKQGGLMGGTPDEAFTVACGVPSTMTPQDVLNGHMNVAIKVQMIHPAEFIDLSFTQKMAS